MFRKIDDFSNAWAYEREATIKVFYGLTPPSLSQPVVPGGRTLGRIAWHIVGSLQEMMSHAGLPAAGPTDADPQPPLDEMIRLYESGSTAVLDLVKTHWTDDMLAELIPMYGEQWPRGTALNALISHQAHHRGQMTVLMRQAGLRVPGVYGPAREEWAAMNLPPQD